MLFGVCLLEPIAVKLSTMFNLFFFIILAALVVSFVLELVADLLNLSAQKGPLPDLVSDVYDAEKYEKSQKYLAVRTRFGQLVGVVQLVVLLVFWFTGGFNLADKWARAAGFGPLVTGLIYVGGLFFVSSLLSLPTALYSTFVIEERFGFNRTTPGTFVADRLKGLLLAILIGGPLLTGLLWFFGRFPTTGWLFAWGALFGFTLLVQFLAPALIMPLFHKFTPIKEGELKEAIEALAKACSFPLGGIYVIDGSRRSAKSNAFFTGFGKTRRIALYDTLIENHTVEEVTAVLAHEIGHWKRGHIIKGMATGFLETGLQLGLLSLFLTSPRLFAAFGMDAPSVYAGLLFFGLLYSPVSTLLSLLMHAVSRHHEFQADAYAGTHADPKALTSALKKLSSTNLSNLTPHPFYVFLHYSHPPLIQRIQALKS